MSKTVTSPVKHFPGSVVLADPQTYPQYLAWRAAVTEAAGIEDIDLKFQAFIPGVCAVVEKWELEGYGTLTPDNFPATPRLAAVSLVGWLVGEVNKIVTGAGTDSLPNE